MLKLMVLMKMGLSFYKFRKKRSFSVSFLAVRCSYITKGMRYPATIRNRHAFLVKNYIFPLMIQQGIMAASMIAMKSRIHAQKEFI